MAKEILLDTVLDTTTNSDSFLLTLEAIWIRDIKPKINTKDEFRSRELIIRIEFSTIIFWICHLPSFTFHYEPIFVHVT